MKSRVDLERARAMREQGMTLQVIGDEFGVSRERIRQLVGSPISTRACGHCSAWFESGRASQRYCSRACAIGAQNAHRGECVDCGAPCSRVSVRCVDCYIAEHERVRLERWTLITELWNEGLSLKEMALRLGTTPGALGVQMAYMKHAGWELTPRRAGWHGFDRQPGVAASEEPPKTRSESRGRFTHAIRTGRLVRPGECERCGHEGRVDGHHHDYSKPLEVEWLCRPCHMAHHVEERKAA